MTYYLATEAMRVVEKNDRGVVTKRKRYTKGDEVDASLLAEGRLDQLLADGSLVESEDEVNSDEDTTQSSVTATANFVSAGSTSTAPHNEAGTAVSPVEEAGGDPQEDLDADEESGGEPSDDDTDDTVTTP